MTKYRDQRNDPAILEAAKQGDIAAVRHMLRTDRAAARRADEDGRTPLHQAAEHGSAAAVAKLLELRAAVHAVTNEGRTPLHYAAYNGKLEAARLLLGAKADARAKGNDGETALDLAREYARRRGQTEVVRLLEDAETPEKCTVRWMLTDTVSREPLHMCRCALVEVW
eukprot:Skav224039  [mRNA]  locus=scaffold2030:35303:41589:- [translate_table: standard]